MRMRAHSCFRVRAFRVFVLPLNARCVFCLFFCCFFFLAKG